MSVANVTCNHCGLNYTTNAEGYFYHHQCHPASSSAVTATKDRWDLLPDGVVRQLVKVLTFGAIKHSEYGWKDISREEHYSALMRHIDNYRCGTVKDKETDMPSLAHAMARIAFIMWLDEEGRI